MSLTTLAMTLALAAGPIRVSVTSPEHRVPLVELFTSEGCSSCPPADRFLAGIGTRPGVLGDAVVPLAFHVTYWDYIGWQDRFAAKVYDQRQAAYARSAASSSIYTPQLLVDGRSVREGITRVAAAIEAAAREESTLGLRLSAELDAAGRSLVLHATSATRAGKTVPGEPLILHLVVFERNLETTVDAGENADKKLKHDFVVRALPAPSRCPAGQDSCQAEARIHVPHAWKPRDLGVAAFAQGERSLLVYQSVATMLSGR